MSGRAPDVQRRLRHGRIRPAADLREARAVRARWQAVPLIRALGRDFAPWLAADLLILFLTVQLARGIV